MNKTAIFISLMMGVIHFTTNAQNPIIQTIFTADPAPMVHNDTVYLYTTHDEDKSTWFTMKDWRCYSSADMVNWTDHGSPLSLDDFSWADKDAWAAQCIYRNGKYYFYICAHHKTLNRMAIGVAVSDKPTGPFTDPIGKPLVADGCGDIDPTVFLDDDSQAYLYWGNPHLKYVKLNEDMISYNEKVGVVRVPLSKKGFAYRIRNADNTFNWAKSVDGLNAHAIKNKKDNRLYWFVSAVDKATKKNVIALGTSDRAIGSYVDILKKPFISEHVDGSEINPTVVIDNDKQAWLTWGKESLWYVKLYDDFQSYDPDFGIQEIPTDKKSWFADRIKDAGDKTEKRHTTYEEGPWMYKRNNLYYLLYPAGGVPEHLAYSTSTSPTGPWMYQDTIMNIIKENGAFTNHPGLIDFKGNSYLFYHNGALPGGGGFNRSVCIDQFDFNADGTIPLITPTKKGVLKSVSNLNPFKRIEAETIAWGKGVETASAKNGQIYVTNIDNSDYIKVRRVDFGKGAKKFEATLASNSSGGSIEIRVDSKDGNLLGTLEVKSTGGDKNWKAQSCKVKRVKGVHDIYFVFKSSENDLFNFNWWKFK
jgi:arabinoxylan arabinofuranohydrolase